MNKERLNKFLAKTTLASSRRKADELIEQGKVKINGKVAFLGAIVDPENDQISVNGKKIKEQNANILIALHKPKGYVCTKSDPYAKKTVYDLLPGEYRNSLHLIGRLDIDSTGLVLLTNNGELTYQLTHPSREHEKEYVVIVKGVLGEKTIHRLESGILLNGIRTAPAKISLIDPIRTNTKTRFHIVIHEGRKHQIRRMLDAVKYPVVFLQRIRIGPYSLGDLREGEWGIIEQ